MTLQAPTRPRPATTTEVDVEEMRTTRSEKLLAFVLAGFLLIGGLWVYAKLDDVPSKPAYPSGGTLRNNDPAYTRYGYAQDAVRRARVHEASARGNLEIKREAYRTTLDAGRPSASARQEYAEAQARFDAAQQARVAAERRAAALKPAADALQRQADSETARASREYDADKEVYDRNVFLLRLFYVLGTVGLGYWLLSRVRRRHPRFMVLMLAFAGFAAVQALYMTGDYGYDYVDFKEVGLATISLAGIVMTIIAFLALQRYLARRLPMRRVRRRECPFCGFPVGDNERCEGCGRAVYGSCSTCSNRRRVGTAHCGVCGAT
jgi:hypothetical protein